MVSCTTCGYVVDEATSERIMLNGECPICVHKYEEAEAFAKSVCPVCNGVNCSGCSS